MATGRAPVSSAVLGELGLLVLGVALLAICFAIALDRAWKDLRFLYVLPAWAFYSVMMSLVTVWALVLEARRVPSRWNKLARTGVVSRGPGRRVQDPSA